MKQCKALCQYICWTETLVKSSACKAPWIEAGPWATNIQHYHYQCPTAIHHWPWSLTLIMIVLNDDYWSLKVISNELLAIDQWPMTTTTIHIVQVANPHNSARATLPVQPRSSGDWSPAARATGNANTGLWIDSMVTDNYTNIMINSRN